MKTQIQRTFPEIGFNWLKQITTIVRRILPGAQKQHRVTRLGCL